MSAETLDHDGLAKADTATQHHVDGVDDGAPGSLIGPPLHVLASEDSVNQLRSEACNEEGVKVDAAVESDDSKSKGISDVNDLKLVKVFAITTIKLHDELVHTEGWYPYWKCVEDLRDGLQEPIRYFWITSLLQERFQQLLSLDGRQRIVEDYLHGLLQTLVRGIFCTGADFLVSQTAGEGCETIDKPDAIEVTKMGSTRLEDVPTDDILLGFLEFNRFIRNTMDAEWQMRRSIYRACTQKTNRNVAGRLFAVLITGNFARAYFANKKSVRNNGQDRFKLIPHVFQNGEEVVPVCSSFFKSFLARLAFAYRCEFESIWLSSAFLDYAATLDEIYIDENVTPPRTWRSFDPRKRKDYTVIPDDELSEDEDGCIVNHTEVETGSERRSEHGEPVQENSINSDGVDV